ncbi:hypothetical protein KUCAC02_021134, partial [Chaenocephalus aceratus]
LSRKGKIGTWVKEGQQHRAEQLTARLTENTQQSLVSLTLQVPHLLVLVQSSDEFQLRESDTDLMNEVIGEASLHHSLICTVHQGTPQGCVSGPRGPATAPSKEEEQTLIAGLERAQWSSEAGPAPRQMAVSP